MINYFKTYVKNLIYYFCLLFCILFLSLSFYIIFLRERLPKNIPFELTEFRLYLLIYICFIYVYIIFRIYKPKTPPEFVIIILKYLSKPFSFLDIELKNKIFPTYYAQFFFYIVPLLNNLGYRERNFIYCVFNIIPRIFLILVLLLDIFYLKKISIFYYFILLGIFPLVYTYYTYTLIALFEGYLKLLENFYTKVYISEKDNYFPDDWVPQTEEDKQQLEKIHSPKAIYHGKIVTLREYIKIQYNVYFEWHYDDKKTQYEYEGSPFLRDEYYKKYTSIALEDDELMYEKFNLYMPLLIKLNKFLELKKETDADPIFKKIKIAIYICYLICWIYILACSIHTLQDISFTLKLLEILNEYREKVDFLG